MHSTRNTLIVCLSLLIVTILSGCRITGGSSGSKKSIQYESPKTVWTNAYTPLILNEQSPRARYRVDVHVKFGDYKKKKAGWDQFFYTGHSNKKNVSVLNISVYKSDGITLLTSTQNTLGMRKTTSQSGAVLTPISRRKTGELIQIQVTDNKLKPDVLPKNVVAIDCALDAKTCQTSFIYEVELNIKSSKMINADLIITPAQGAYFGSQANIQAHEECFTFLACVDGKDVKKIRPSVTITRIN